MELGSEFPHAGVRHGRRRRCRRLRGRGRWRREEAGHERRGQLLRGRMQRARRGALPAQLRDAAPADELEEARAGVARAANPVLLLCFTYDAATGRYTLAVTKAIRVAAVVTVLVIAGSLAWLHRRGAGA